MTTSREELEQQIEKLVSEHIEGCHKAVAAAVERAFGKARCTAPARPQRQDKPASHKVQPRRSAAELEELSERLYEAVCAKPGETMTVLAARLGTSSRSLERPAGRLRRAGRVRSIGERNGTRYFPIAKNESGARPALVTIQRAAVNG